MRTRNVSPDYSQKEAVNREKVAATSTYSILRLKVQRPPNPLSLFSAGLETRFGSELDIAFDSVPALTNPIVDVRPEEEQWAFGGVPSLSSPGAPLGINNPYLYLFSQIDLVFIFQVVLSLLSLLFAYDAIAGDWETGTLRLVLSHPVRRGSVLLAKYIAAMICLLLPVLMSLLLTLIQCSFARSLQFSTDDFLRVGGIVLTTIVYLSGFLPDRSARFHNNPPCLYIPDALHVLMGSLGACLSKLEPICLESRWATRVEKKDPPPSR